MLPSWTNWYICTQKMAQIRSSDRIQATKINCCTNKTCYYRQYWDLIIMSKQGSNPSTYDTGIIEFSYINNMALKAVKTKLHTSCTFAPHVELLNITRWQMFLAILPIDWEIIATLFILQITFKGKQKLNFIWQIKSLNDLCSLIVVKTICIV